MVVCLWIFSGLRITEGKDFSFGELGKCWHSKQRPGYCLYHISYFPFIVPPSLFPEQN